MAKAKLGHFFLLFIYPPLLGGLVVGLGLLIWGRVVDDFYPYRPEVISPLPITAATAQPPVSAENLWLPQEGAVTTTELKNLPIQAEAYLALDLKTGQILAAKNHHQRRPVASLVKIMTALVAVDRSSLDNKIKVSKRAASIGEDSMVLKAGEKLSLNDLLYGLILVSGNDAAEAIAEGIAGRRELFVAWMNLKAHELGLTDTQFVNPTGLMEGNGVDQPYRAEEYSTAYDLAVISRAFLEKKVLREIAATPSYFVPADGDHRAYQLDSQTSLLTTDPRVKGIKMGYTPAAGLSGVSYAEDQGRELIVVVLNSPNRREDLKTLINYSFRVINT